MNQVHEKLFGLTHFACIPITTLMRILAVDPGEKRLGIALSDPSGSLARPLMVIPHVSRAEDARRIVQLAEAHQAGKIIIGQALDVEGNPTYSGRKAARLAAAVRSQTNLPVKLWDESESTQSARASLLTMGAPQRKRRGHLDALAAAVILQSYLDELRHSQ
jgi:putative Holliday junction resolvase